jgi:DNA-binding transcriptional LysR family regulator
MDPELLSVLQAVVERGGFSRAGAAVHLTQSAVSQAIARLEHAVGSAVLTRSRPPRPTELGARLLRHAREQAARDALLRRDLDDIRRGGGGVLALGASQALTTQVLPALVKRFLAARPRAGLHLETHPSRELIRVVAEGRLELGLGPFQRQMAGLATHALGSQRMVLHVARGSAAHRALRRDGVEALHDVPLVTSHLDAPDARRGGGRLRERFATVWEVQSLDLRLQLVGDGLAVGYLPEASVVAAGRKRALVAVDWLDFGVIERRYGLFHLADRELSTPAGELVGLAAR